MLVMVVDGYGWASRYQIFAAGAPWLRTSHIFFINKTLIPVLLNLKDEGPLEIKKIH
jgi:hypothetical protein